MMIILGENMKAVMNNEDAVLNVGMQVGLRSKHRKHKAGLSLYVRVSSAYHNRKSSCN
jgi:hypothetical protein